MAVKGCVWMKTVVVVVMRRIDEFSFISLDLNFIGFVYVVDC